MGGGKDHFMASLQFDKTEFDKKRCLCSEATESNLVEL